MRNRSAPRSGTRYRAVAGNAPGLARHFTEGVTGGLPWGRVGKLRSRLLIPCDGRLGKVRARYGASRGASPAASKTLAPIFPVRKSQSPAAPFSPVIDVSGKSISNESVRVSGKGRGIGARLASAILAGSTYSARVIEIGSRARTLPAPPPVVWDSLVEPRRPGTRPWLHLLADEVEPRVLAAEKPGRVVWSSLWPKPAR